jgi:hypothetical protein
LLNELSADEIVKFKSLMIIALVPIFTFKYVYFIRLDALAKGMHKFMIIIFFYWTNSLITIW